MKRYRFLALALALALIAPALLAVPASAADFISTGNFSLTCSSVSSDGRTFFPDTYTFSYNSTDYCYYDFFLTNGTSDTDKVKIPVGDNVAEIYISGAMYVDAVSMYHSTFTLGVCLLVNCYDSNGAFISNVRSSAMIGNNFSGTCTYTVSVSGAQFPVGTSFFVVQLSLASGNGTLVNGFSGFAGNYNAAGGLSIHTSEFDWTSDGFDTIPTAQSCPFVYSHDGQEVYLTSEDTLTLALFAEGFSGVDLYARFNSQNGSTKTVQLYYDSVRMCHYNAFNYVFTDSNIYNVVSVDFLINDSVVYSSLPTYIYYPGWEISDSGTASDEGIGDSITEVKEDVQAVMEAVGETNDKIDTLTEQVEEEMGVVQDQLEESNNKLEQVVEGVTSLPQKIGDAILGLFVPSEEDMSGIKDQWAQLLSDRFGAVYDAVAIVDEIASSFKEQTTQETITFPSVSIPLSGVNFEFGGWEVDVVPDGLEFFIEIVKKAIDIVCTLFFINGMKSRYEKTLEGRG